MVCAAPRACRLVRVLFVALVLVAAVSVTACDVVARSSGTSSPIVAEPSDVVSEPPDLVVEPSDVVAPSTADPATGGIPVSAAGVGVVGQGDVVVQVYLDFMCPWCAVFEEANGEDIADLVAEGGVTVVYHPVSILDRMSQGTAYSTRAANAAAVIADQDPDRLLAFFAAMFAEGTRPEEGTEGLTDQQLAEVAQSIGVPQSVTDQFADVVPYQGTTTRTFVPWIIAGQADIPGTPTVLIDDRRWTGDFTVPGELAAAIEAARR